MSHRGIRLGSILGIAIDLDYSWFLILGLLSWSLAVSYYPAEFPAWSATEYWSMGVITALCLFVSVLLHELGHSIVATHYGIRVPRITLFVFGGVSEIASEPPGAAQEFAIAATGPLVSFALAVLFWELEPLAASSEPLFGLFKYLSLLNLILGAFNLIPGFPLDGGRVFRSIVWRITGHYERATSVAATVGRVFGFAFIFFGVWEALRADFIGGLWIAFIGWFLESAAASQLQVATIQHLLGAHTVTDAMRRQFPVISGDVSLQELVDKYMLPSGVRYAVVSSADGRPPGLVTLGSIRAIPRASWATTFASQAMVPMGSLAATSPDAGLWSALEKMGRDGVNQLPVVKEQGIVGVLSREDVLHYLQTLRAFAT